MGHHYVPRRYLRNFEDPDKPGFIWLHDKHGNPPRLAPIANVAQADKFYSAQTEMFLAQHVEPSGNAAIEKLTSGLAITQAERVQLAYYISVTLKRVPARRRRAQEMMPGVLADVVSDTRRELEALAAIVQADPALLSQRLQEVDAAGKRFAQHPPQEVLEQIREPWPTEEMLWAVFRMTWRILVSSGPQHFITTDNPAFFFHAHGLGNRESELSVPLSKTHALHGSWQAAGSDLVFAKAQQRIVKEINRRLASQTERIAFYYEPAPWLLKILPKKYPCLSAIHWSS
jgi:hypothetical protein